MAFASNTQSFSDIILSIHFVVLGCVFRQPTQPSLFGHPLLLRPRWNTPVDGARRYVSKGGRPCEQNRFSTDFPMIRYTRLTRQYRSSTDADRARDPDLRNEDSIPLNDRIVTNLYEVV
jgi:hypothetical protein